MDTTSPIGTEAPRRGPRLQGSLRLFVRVRFGAALAALAVIAACELLFHLDFPYGRLYAITAGIMAYDLGFYLFCGRERREPQRGGIDEEADARVNRFAALLQINLDFAALTGLLHFSGGLENPFVLFFLFHVVIAGILLEAPLAAAEAVLAALLIFGLGALEKVGALAHHHAGAVLGSLELASNWVFVLGLSGLMAATIAALSAFTIALMGQRTRQRNQLLALSRDLAAKNEKLQELDLSRRKLLAVASHDLKSPLGAVTSYLHAVRDGYLGPVTPEQGDVIDKSLKRLDRLREFIGDILSLQAIRHGEVQKAMQPTDVGGLLREVVQNHVDPARGRSIAVAFEAEGDLPFIEAAPEQLVQVFDNLLSNAVKYTREGGTVRVTARVRAGHLLVDVADTGIGISPEDLEHLFEDFFRAAAVRETHEGTGLGLAVCQRIVRAHHGEIRATSEPGAGTVFHVGLPVVQPLHSILPEERDSEPLIAEILQTLHK
jgi:signal transduction histidine kinase